MKTMLKNSIKVLLCLSLFITSCHEEVNISKKVDVIDSKQQPVTNTGKDLASNARQQPYSMTWIRLDATTHEYVCSYGTGITFGANFPHPITVDATGLTDGEPAGGFDFVGFREVPTLYFTIANNKFDLVQPAFPGGPSANDIYAYFYGLRLYWLGSGANAERPNPLGNATGGGSTIEIRGQVVRDHTSPTNVSVISDDYVYTPPVNNPNPGSSTFPLGELHKNGYTFSLFGPSGSPTSGTVVSVTAKNANGATVSAIPLNVHYTMNYAGDQYHLTGSIKVYGAIIPVDDYIGSAI
jgi:hypothetical protein